MDKRSDELIQFILDDPDRAHELVAHIVRSWGYDKQSQEGIDRILACKMADMKEIERQAARDEDWSDAS